MALSLVITAQLHKVLGESVPPQQEFNTIASPRTAAANKVTLLCIHGGGVIHGFCCSVAQSCLPLCNPVDCSTSGSSVLHYLLQFAQTHGHWVFDAIQPSHPLPPPSPPALSLSQHQDLFQWVSCLHQVAKVLELQLQQQLALVSVGPL